MRFLKLSYMVYARGEEKLLRRRRVKVRGSGGMFPQKILKFRVSEMPFPAFSVN